MIEDKIDPFSFFALPRRGIDSTRGVAGRRSPLHSLVYACSPLRIIIFASVVHAVATCGRARCRFTAVGTPVDERG